MNDKITSWLLEDDNPAVKYRMQTELLGETDDNAEAKAWIFGKIPENWHETKGLWYTYYITALAECGMAYKDIPIKCLERGLDIAENQFQYGCADFMLLRSLVMLGLQNHTAVANVINNFQNSCLPDNGFLCERRLKSFKYIPKSCYKANIQALMLMSELHKKNINVSFGKPLVDYFLNRNIFYRNDDKTKLILDGREGWRIIDTFHPFEPMRIGIHNVAEAFSSLGYGNDERLNEAWKFLYKYKSEDGKMILSQTLTKSYLPKERVGVPSKWVTFYTLLAEKERKFAEKR